MQQAENIARSTLAARIPEWALFKTHHKQMKKRNSNRVRQRIQSLYERLFQRPATLHEMENLENFLGEFETTVTKNKETELETWTALVHTLLLSSEYIHVD